MQVWCNFCSWHCLAPSARAKMGSEELRVRAGIAALHQNGSALLGPFFQSGLLSLALSRCRRRTGRKDAVRFRGASPVLFSHSPLSVLPPPLLPCTPLTPHCPHRTCTDFTVHWRISGCHFTDGPGCN